jgi:uncharacterized coiled-coil DUF342 family protein
MSVNKLNINYFIINNIDYQIIDTIFCLFDINNNILYSLFEGNIYFYKMNKDVIKFKVSELVKLRDGLINREEELRNSLTNLATAKKNIINILSEFENGTKDGIIFLPKDIFEKINTNSKHISTNFNWKKIALEIIKNSDSFLTTSELYTKAKIKYPVELSDKAKAIRGFSAALQYLLKEGKIVKNIKGKKYLYGIELKNK